MSFLRQSLQLSNWSEILRPPLNEAVQTWHFALVVDALRALRGVNTIIAATLVAEIGDITRFENPRQLMA
jgi:transposase